MKKILVSFIIILILGGAVFFFGWVQFRVPAGSYGVMRSRTHGLDTALIREGEFRWEWYAVIPTNVEITVFTLKPVEQTIGISGSLPSGDIYASFAGLEADFSYEYSGSLSFMVKPDVLPGLTAARGIASQEDLEAYQRRLSDEITAFSVRCLEEYAGEGGGLLESAGDKLEGDILSAYPDIENLFCTIRAARFPDYALYRAVRKTYEDYVTEQQRILEPGIFASANRYADTRLRLDELAKYGELLTKYPILLQYLALEKGEAAGNLRGSPVVVPDSE
jgi:hypothetical protein